MLKRDIVKNYSYVDKYIEWTQWINESIDSNDRR